MTPEGTDTGCNLYTIFPMTVLSRHVYTCDIQNSYLGAIDEDVACDVVARNAILVVVRKHPRLSFSACLESAFIYLLGRT